MLPTSSGITKNTTNGEGAGPVIVPPGTRTRFLGKLAALAAAEELSKAAILLRGMSLNLFVLGEQRGLLVPRLILGRFGGMLGGRMGLWRVVGGWSWWLMGMSGGGMKMGSVIAWHGAWGVVVRSRSIVGGRGWLRELGKHIYLS